MPEDTKKPKEKKEKEKKPTKTELLDLLRTSDDQSVKRKVRAQLRAMGHAGGLNEGRGRKAEPKDKEKKSTKPKGKRAKAAVEEDETD